MKNNLLILFLSIVIASCSSDNGTDTPPVTSETPNTPDTPQPPDNPDTGGDEGGGDEGGDSNTNGKKILSLESSFDAGATFWKTNFDTTNRPAESFDNQSRLVSKYIYEGTDAFAPTKKEFYNGDNLISTAIYIYDSSKRLIEYKTGTTTSNRTFEYVGNDVIIRFELLPNDYNKLIFDDQKRILKIEEHSTEGSIDEIISAIDFTYENENLIQFKKEDIKFGVNSFIDNYTFDDQKNPFYNQFKDNNINYLLESSFDLETRALQLYSKNNLVTQSFENATRTLEYTDEGYPTIINTTYSEDTNKVDVEKFVYQN